jgi:hypothetical protein
MRGTFLPKAEKGPLAIGALPDGSHDRRVVSVDAFGGIETSFAEFSPATLAAAILIAER